MMPPRAGYSQTVAAVIASAVSDAIGKPIRNLPITPFDVLAALREESENPAKGTTR